MYLRYGLREVPNPSEVMLSGRPVNAPGTCVSCVMQGSRPILAEVQALLSPSNANQSRRTAAWTSALMLLLAVLEKRGGVRRQVRPRLCKCCRRSGAGQARGEILPSRWPLRPVCGTSLSGKISPRSAKSDSQEKFDPFRQSINACRSLHDSASSDALYRRTARTI